jgi:hypothetical protein
MHDRRQHPQQDAGMLARKGEMPADTKIIPAAIVRDDAAIRPGRKKREGIDRRQSQIACQAERPPARQQEAVPRL